MTPAQASMTIIASSGFRLLLGQILLVMLCGAAAAAPLADSPPFTLDTRDSAGLPTSSNFFVLDTRADPLSLDPNLTLAGDISGNKRLTLADFLLLAQYVDGSRSAADPLIGDSAAADATGSGSATHADVRLVGQWLLGTDGSHEPRTAAPGFLISMIEPASAAPGALVEISVTGEVAETIRAVRFDGQLSPVVGQIDAHRVTVAVPFLAAGPVQVTAMVDAWETQGHPFQVLPVAQVDGPPGEFSSRVVDSIGSSMTEFNRVVVPDLVALDILTPVESQDFVNGINRMIQLLGEVQVGMGDLPVEARATLDSLLYSGEMDQAIAAFESEASMLSGPSAMRDRAFSGPYDLFNVYVALDALAASLGNLKLTTDAVSVVSAVSGVASAAAPILAAGSVAIGGMKNVIDGTIPTDIARLRATFSDGSPEFFIDQEKELFFFGDFRTESDPIQAVLGTALDGVFGIISISLPGADAAISEILKKTMLKASRVGIDSVHENLLFNHLDLESWHHDVRVPIAFYTPTAQGLMHRGLTYLPAGTVFAPNLALAANTTFATRSPWVEHPGASTPAVLNIINGHLLPATPGQGILHYDAFNFRKAKSFWGQAGTLGQAYPQRISDPGYNPFTSRFQPPDSSPADEDTILPFDFTVQAATVRVRPNPTTASWSISGDRNLSGTGNQDFLIRPGSYTITWGNLFGYDKPANQSASVGDGGTITFSGTYTEQSGTLQVRPSLSSASWTVSGPNSYSNSGSGNQNLTVAPGTYTVTWGAVSGYNTPGSATVSVTNGGTATANGTYTEQSGTLQVRPSLSSATWTVSGPNNYFNNGSGNQNLTVAPGTYTVTWGAVSGYNTPPITTVSVTNGGTATANGTYSSTEQSGTLQVRPSLSSATWTVSGPNNYSNNGSGNQNLTVAPGTYTVTWGAMSGYNTPGSTTVSVTNGGTATANGTYSSTGSFSIVEGTVTDGNGQPLQGVNVRIVIAGNDSIFTTTNSNGYYTSTLPAGYTGHVRVRMDKDGYMYNGGEGSSSTQTTYTFDRSLMLLSSILSGSASGLVTNSSGQALGGVTISFRQGHNNQTGSVLRSATTWSDGTYREVATTGDYTLAASISGFTTQYRNISLSSGQDLKNQSFQLGPTAARAPLEDIDDPFAPQGEGDTTHPDDASEEEVIAFTGPAPARGEHDPAHDLPADDGTHVPADPIPQTPMLPPVIAKLDDWPQPTLVRAPRISRMNTPDFSHLEALIDLEETVALGSSALPDPLPIGTEVTVTFTLSVPQGVIGAFYYDLRFDPARVEITAIEAAEGSPYADSLVSATGSGNVRLMAARPQLSAESQADAAFVVRLRRLDGAVDAPALRLRPLGLLEADTSPLLSAETELLLVAGESLGWPGLPPEDLDSLYEIWAAANLPAHERGRHLTSSIFGVPNLLAFALGWTAADPASRRQPHIADLEAGGIWLHTLRRAELPGLVWTWHASEDLQDWQPVTPLETRVVPVGEGMERWETRLPAPADRRFFQLKLEPAQP
jgi:hypothetical protein